MYIVEDGLSSNFAVWGCRLSLLVRWVGVVFVVDDVVLKIMVRDHKKDVKPLLLQLGVALAISFVGFLYSRLRTNPKPTSSSGESRTDSGGREIHKEEIDPATTTAAASDIPGNQVEASPRKIKIARPAAGFASHRKHSEDEEGFLLPEFDDLVLNQFQIPSTKKDLELPTSMEKSQDMETSEEIMNLRNTVRVLQERERVLEFQLLEYYGIKEQQKTVMELQNRLKVNSMEAKLLNLKIESLQADKKRLKAQVADYVNIKAELESAKMNIKILKRNIMSDGDQTKEQLSTLQQKVANLQDQELGKVGNSEDTRMNQEILKELQGELAQLRMANSRLQSENSELARKLEASQVRASSVSELPEDEALQNANHRLREENNNLTEEVEQLQANRSADVEELVYLRWVNACLRYELRNYQPPPGITVARDLGKSLSPRSEEKAKQLILEYANSEEMGDKIIRLMDFDTEYWSSSQDSNLSESGEYDGSSVDVSTGKRTNTSRKIIFFNKLRKLVRGKDKNNKTSIDSRNTSERMESVSEDLTYTASTVSSQYSSNSSAFDLMAIEARAERHRSKLAPLPFSRASSDQITRNKGQYGDRTPSFNASGRGEATSAGSFEEMEGTYSGKIVTSHLCSTPSSTEPMAPEAKVDEDQSKLVLPSQKSSRSSMDIQRIRNQTLENIKNVERGRRKSDVGSLHGYNRVILREEGVSGLQHDSELDQNPSVSEKLELKKFAEVLKGSNVSPKPRKKSVSYG